MTGVVDDFQDAVLDAQAEVMDVLRDVGRELFMAMAEKKAKAVWAQMSADDKERFKTERPQEYAEFMKGLER